MKSPPYRGVLAHSNDLLVCAWGGGRCETALEAWANHRPPKSGKGTLSRAQGGGFPNIPHPPPLPPCPKPARRPASPFPPRPLRKNTPNSKGGGRAAPP